MKKIKPILYKVVSLIFIALSINHNISAQSLLGGLLQFSKHTNIDPINITICHCGKTIPTQKHTTGIPKVTYEIPKYNSQTKFSILVTPTAPTYELKQLDEQKEEQNTIDYLKLDAQTPYLFYTLELVPDEVSSTQQQDGHWITTESSLPENGQIPDDAIIIVYFPYFIKGIRGGSSLDLPTIYIDNSDIDVFGSEENFDDAIIRLQLTSLDVKALHIPTKQKIHTDNSCRVMIMDTVT